MFRLVPDGGVLLMGPRVGAGRVSGARLGFELTITAFERNGLRHEIVDTTASHVDRAGAFGMKRAIDTLRVVTSFLRTLPHVQTVCVTIGSSRLGFLRDALVVWPSRLLGRKIVLHLYGGGYGLFYAAQPAWLKHIIGKTLGQARIIVVEGELLREQFGFVPDIGSKIRVIPNGLPEGLQPNITAGKSWRSPNPFRLLYLSNMIESKGYLDVLAACRILKEKHNFPIQCDFCGEFVRTSVDDGNQGAEELEKGFYELVNRWGLHDVVSYRGVVSGDLKQQLLTDAHLFLLPTAYPWEGQPFSIIEALAFGTPVITTRYRGIPEQVMEGFNGFFVEPHAPERIAEVITRILDDPRTYGDLSRNALAHYRKHFTQEVHVNRVLSVVCGLDGLPGSEQGERL